MLPNRATFTLPKRTSPNDRHATSMPPPSYQSNTWSESMIADGPTEIPPTRQSPIGPCSMVKTICRATPCWAATCGTTYMGMPAPRFTTSPGRNSRTARRAMTTFSSSGQGRRGAGDWISPLIRGSCSSSNSSGATTT